MPDLIDFYFDFSSPYSYLAFDKIAELCADTGCALTYKPIMLGPLMKAEETKPLVQYPKKGAYSMHDWDRYARFLGLPHQFPDRFPVATLAAARGFWWLDDRDPDLAKRYARAVVGAYFGAGRDITQAAVLGDVCTGLGIDGAALWAATREAAVKQRLIDETAAAANRGVFGAPFFFIGDEPFWGSDRIWMMRKWIESGGWS